MILDFWATWCVPCIASFPAMQQSVQNFENDEEVVFFFVNTFENIPDRSKKLKDFLTENKYDFHVLLDQKSSGKSKYNAADKFGIRSIPSKIIIGPDGFIKFRSTGFNGSNDKLVEEIEMMVELVKNTS